MSILEFVYHRHYWSIPHRREGDNGIIQTCYDCGRDRESLLIIGEGPRSEPNRAQSKSGKRRSRLRLPWRNPGAGNRNQIT